jgi:hypothetical protein
VKLDVSQPYLSFVPAGASSQPYELQNAQFLVKSIDEKIAAIGRLRSLIQLEYSIDELLSWALVKIKDTTSQNK